MLDPLIRNLESHGRLSGAEKKALRLALARTRTIEAGEDVVRPSDRSTEVSVLLDGFACRYTLVNRSKRQITAILIPGDICTLQAAFLPIDHSVSAFTQATFGFISRDAIRVWTETLPNLTRLLWCTTFVDGTIYQEWLGNIGRRSAYQRLAHLLCEVMMRLRHMGLANDRSYELPFTQIDLADAMGLTPAHTNRVLQRLRREGLIRTEGRTVVISDWQRLARAGDFDEQYLHLPHP